MNEKFLEVGDVMQILGISRSAAYKLMRQINSELEKKGYIVIRGKVSRKYVEERIYGMSDRIAVLCSCRMSVRRVLLFQREYMGKMYVKMKDDDFKRLIQEFRNACKRPTS